MTHDIPFFLSLSLSFYRSLSLALTLSVLPPLVPLPTPSKILSNERVDMGGPRAREFEEKNYFFPPPIFFTVS